jgi:hypothetical protein
MPVHWTYQDCELKSDLEQGDILNQTTELKALLSEVHPHFASEKYVGFLVATQSCDLVRRRAQLPKATHVTLAAVRPLVQVLPRLIGQVASPLAVGLFRSSSKVEAQRLLTRILNQNEQALGLFFLHQEADSGIFEPCVSQLRVTVALRSDHYNLLLSARTGRLRAEFQAKLGWLLGNLFARPATRDWGDDSAGASTLKGLIASFLSEQTPGLGPRWLDDEIVNEAKSKGIAIANARQDELEQLRPAPPHEKALEVIRTQLRKVAPELPSESLDKLSNRLRNNGEFKNLFKSVTAG